MINIFYSTVTNVAPQALQTATATATEDLTKTVEEVEQEPVSQDRQEPTSSTASSTAPKSRKKVSKKQQFNIELSKRILNLAEKEDDQVDLELAAIGARIKRKLNNDEIDDILDEIKEVTKAFFQQEEKTARNSGSISTSGSMCTTECCDGGIPTSTSETTPKATHPAG